MSMIRGADFTRSLLGKTFTLDMLSASLWLPRFKRHAVKGGSDVVAASSYLVNEAACSPSPLAVDYRSRAR